MAASITVQLQIFKRLQLPRCSTDVYETGIKMYGLLRSLISNIVIIRVAVPFNQLVFLLYFERQSEYDQEIPQSHTAD